MKVVDLMKDLEKGDRTMEHLKTGGAEMSPQDFRDSGFADMVNRLSGTISGFPNGLAGSALGLGFANQQAQGLQQFANQQAWGGQSPWR